MSRLAGEAEAASGEFVRRNDAEAAGEALAEGELEAEGHSEIEGEREALPVAEVVTDLAPEALSAAETEGLPEGGAEAQLVPLALTVELRRAEPL